MSNPMATTATDRRPHGTGHVDDRALVRPSDEIVPDAGAISSVSESAVSAPVHVQIANSDGRG